MYEVLTKSTRRQSTLYMYTHTVHTYIQYHGAFTDNQKCCVHLLHNFSHKIKKNHHRLFEFSYVLLPNVLHVT